MTVSWPLTQRGPEALQRLLLADADGVTENLALLTRTELGELADAADRLAGMTREIIAAVWPGQVAVSPTTPGPVGAPEAPPNQDLQEGRQP